MSEAAASRPRILRTWIWPTAAGLLFAGAAMGFLALIPERDALRLLAVLLAFIAAVYLGFAILDGRPAVIAIESIGAAGFAALAVLALWLAEPLFLAVGYLGHGVWDVIHHPRGVDTRMQR